MSTSAALASIAAAAPSMVALLITMLFVISLVLYTITTTPQVAAIGTWPRDKINLSSDGDDWWVDITFTAASSDSRYNGYRAIIARATGGIWLNNKVLEWYDTSDNLMASSSVGALVWSAGQTVRFRFSRAGSTRTCTITGATSGNTSFSHTSGADCLANAAVAFGDADGSIGSFPIGGTLSNIFGPDAALSATGGFGLDEVRVDGAVATALAAAGGFDLDEVRVDGAVATALAAAGGFALDEVRVEGSAAVAAVAAGAFDLDEIRIDGAATVAGAGLSATGSFGLDELRFEGVGAVSGNATGGFALDEVRVDGAVATALAAAGGFALDEVRVDGQAVTAIAVSDGFGLDEVRVAGAAALAGAAGGGFGLDEVRVTGAAVSAFPTKPTLDVCAVVQRIYLTAPATGTLSTAAVDTLDGEPSLYLMVVARGVWAAEPTPGRDNVPNIYAELESHDYNENGFHPTYAGARWALYMAATPTDLDALVASADWGPGDAFGKGDEVTVMFARVKGSGGRRPKLISRAVVERNSAASITGLPVTSTAPALFVSFIMGTNGTGQTHAFTWGGGYVRKASASATGNPDNAGYIQIDTAEVSDDTATGTTKTPSAAGVNNEGGFIVNMAFQLETVEGTGGFALDELRFDGAATAGANVTTGSLALDEMRLTGAAALAAAAAGGFALDEVRFDGTAALAAAAAGGFDLDEIRIAGVAGVTSVAAGAFDLDEIRIDGTATAVGGVIGGFALDEIRIDGQISTQVAVTGGFALDEVRVDGAAGVIAATVGGFDLDEARITGSAVSPLSASGGFALDELRLTGAATTASTAGGSFALDEVRLDGQAVVFNAGDRQASGGFDLDEVRMTGEATVTGFGGGDAATARWLRGFLGWLRGLFAR
jgi:ribosome biogenesis SPOUT family RNA methylase Rps3